MNTSLVSIVVRVICAVAAISVATMFLNEADDGYFWAGVGLMLLGVGYAVYELVVVVVTLFTEEDAE